MKREPNLTLLMAGFIAGLLIFAFLSLPASLSAQPSEPQEKPEISAPERDLVYVFLSVFFKDQDGIGHDSPEPALFVPEWDLLCKKLGGPKAVLEIGPVHFWVSPVPDSAKRYALEGNCWLEMDTREAILNRPGEAT